MGFKLYSFTFKSIASRERQLTGDVFRTANFWFWPDADGLTVPPVSDPVRPLVNVRFEPS
jgi:hypothetical protein